MGTVVTQPEEVTFATTIDDVALKVSAAKFNTGTIGNAWHATLKRYARRIGGYTRWNEVTDPSSIVDPLYGPSNVIVRARDTLAFLREGALPAGVTNQGLCYWGFAGNPGGMPTPEAANTYYVPFVGFRSSVDANAAGVAPAAIWECLVVSDALTALYRSATTVTTDVAREMTVTLDGTTNTIYWHIDGVQVGSYSPASGAPPRQQINYPNAFAVLWTQWEFLSASSSTSSGGWAGAALYCRMGPAGLCLTHEFVDQ